MLSCQTGWQPHTGRVRPRFSIRFSSYKGPSASRSPQAEGRRELMALRRSLAFSSPRLQRGKQIPGFGLRLPVAHFHALYAWNVSRRQARLRRELEDLKSKVRD